MNHLFRLLWLLITARFRTPLDPQSGVCRTKMRVWPTDLDVLMHMNNGVYLSLMDLGRTDLMFRIGLAKKAQRNGIYPVLASEVIRFRKSLKPFQKFEIETQTAGWDEKYFYVEQKFTSRGETYASALVKARFLKKTGGKVSPQELWQLIGLSRPPSTSHPAIGQLLALEESLKD